MYAVIKTGGKQYRVQPGDLLVVEKLEGDAGAEVVFDQVLMLDGSVGAPLVGGATVSATLIETRKGEKVKIFKKTRRQGYRRTRGHRQQESVLRVTAIDGGKGKQAKWDGTVDLTTKAEIDARARGLARAAEAAAAKAAKRAESRNAGKAAPAAKAKPAKAAPKTADAPVKEAAPKKAAAPKADAKPAKEAAPKKAAAPKAEKTETKAAAHKKPAAKKDK
ncbi:MAG: 50S ribosomal protein L21 [Caulobacteraceae bacterium]|nr:50S ribosomal protein L21 [Caulobacteraceae bacterium]